MRLFASIIWCLGFALSLRAEPIPPKPQPAKYCNDFANLLSSDEAITLESKLESYYDSTSTQLVVVIVHNLDGMALWEYAQQLGEKWGVGQKDKDNGLVLLIATEEHKIFITTGYGLEDKITDAQSKRIITQIISPAFKQKAYAAGINQALDRIIALCSGQYVNDTNPDEGSSISLFQLILIVVFVIIILRIIARNGGGTNYHRRGYNSWGGSPYWNSSGGGGGSSFGGGSFGGGGAGGDW